MVAEHLLDRERLGDVVAGRARAVGDDVVDVSPAEARPRERRVHRQHDAAAVGRRVGHPVRVQARAVAGELGQDRAPRSSAESQSSSTTTTAPSPRTKPERSRSNGRDARSGRRCTRSSGRRAARSRARRTTRQRVEAAGDHQLASPSWISRNASPIACAEAVHAVLTPITGPSAPAMRAISARGAVFWLLRRVWIGGSGERRAPRTRPVLRRRPTSSCSSGRPTLPPMATPPRARPRTPGSIPASQRLERRRDAEALARGRWRAASASGSCARSKSAEMPGDPHGERPRRSSRSAYAAAAGLERLPGALGVRSRPGSRRRAR